ncbi:unnamed protein product [Lymnaea stagnalis]|uniref:SPARC-related modular calcium-binding protein 2 n=1 Tax=Lymnaea stagnalis TaxID=6523 RepID=A0AAV2I2J7_LYMST
MGRTLVIMTLKPSDSELSPALHSYVILRNLVFASCVVLAWWSSDCSGVELTQFDGKKLFQSLLSSRCSVNCAASEVGPVCGTDDVTYTSRCELKRAKKCEGKDVKIKKRGPCPGDPGPISKCMSERREAAEAFKRNQHSEVMIPECRDDGSYNQIQCHKSSGYCWCVTHDGRHISGTSTNKGQPRCKGKRKKRKGRGGKPRKTKAEECSSKERQAFNAALIKVVKEEYDRAHSSNTTGQKDFGTEKSIVLWKFNELDQNKDGKLKFKEIRHFKKMVKKLIKPKQCAKDFVTYCDKKMDRTIEKQDWTLCLGVDIKISFHMFLSLNSASEATSSVRPADSPREEMLRTSSPLVHAPNLAVLSSGPSVSSSTSRQEKQDRKENNQNCLEERESAINYNSNDPVSRHFIPACTANGLFEKAQCHNITKGPLYCWCVSQTSGVPIPGTASYNVTPHCEFENERELKGCPFEQKRKFLMDLMGELSAERNKSLSETKDQTNPFPADNLALVETVARWKLKNLDKNNNDILEKKEWRPFRKTTLKNKLFPRKCRRSFLRYCDVDNNTKITSDEWRDCLGLNHIAFNSLPKNQKRKGKNPFGFLFFLKDD